MFRHLLLILSALSLALPLTAQEKKEIYTYIEQMPEPGVNVTEYIAQNIVLPEDAKKNGIDGKVVLRFVVKENGDLDSIKIIKSILPSVDSAVLRIIDNMPAWKPGMQNGKAVAVYYAQAVPIRTLAVTTDKDTLDPEPLFDLPTFLYNNIIYPAKTPDSTIEGNVIVQFKVGIDSNIKSVKTSQGLHPLLDKEVVRVLRLSPKWRPATNNGQPIEVTHSLAIALRWGHEVNNLVIDTEPKPTFELMDYLYLETPYSLPGVKRDRFNRIIVPVTFIINEDGSVSDVQVVRSIDRSLDTDTVKKILSMPKWQPAMSKGKPVKMRYSMNVTYAGRIQ